ncbi:MAG: tRNA pseudouridine(38-40) synthase TruA, partial [Bacteroidales bacterium]|nr:tRNA pseudouridine(38-40) synthase TruA [Bacteroidales bacterium]
MRYFVELAFDGTPFYGWQIQNNAITVQETLEQAFSLLMDEKIALTGCGRTDSGVHAKQFFAHFDTEKEMTPANCRQLTYRLNALLPKTIAIFNIFQVENDRHARFDANSRTYCYYVIASKDPFLLPFALPIYRPLNVDLMNEAALILFEYDDFTSFSKLHTDTKTNLCQIILAEWTEEKDRLIFTIQANRFLRNMVRAIVGTLIEVGSGKLSIAGFREIIEKKDRALAGTSAPAHALF